MASNILNTENALLLIIDIQERLIAAQYSKDMITKNAAILAEAATILGVPVVASEQYPKGLGNTIPEIKEKLDESAKFFEKTAFSCVKQEGFLDLIKSCNRKQIIICGMESHICVHQTVTDLLNEGFEVHVVSDAISSRREFECKIGMDRMVADGSVLTCVETVVFEFLKSAKHPDFKAVQGLIK